MSRARTTVPEGGTFVSVTSAIPDADKGIRDALKLEFRQFVDESVNTSDPLGIKTSFATDRFLVDIAAIDADAIDAKKLAKDCEIVARVVTGQPERIRDLVAAQQKPGGFTAASKIASELRLTEAAASDAGGGLLWLLVIAVAVMAGSCEHCHAGHPPDYD
jgi:hypothetical protein